MYFSNLSNSARTSLYCTYDKYIYSEGTTAGCMQDERLENTDSAPFSGLIIIRTATIQQGSSSSSSSVTRHKAHTRHVHIHTRSQAVSNSGGDLRKTMLLKKHLLVSYLAGYYSVCCCVVLCVSQPSLTPPPPRLMILVPGTRYQRSLLGCVGKARESDEESERRLTTVNSAAV